MCACLTHSSKKWERLQSTAAASLALPDLTLPLLATSAFILWRCGRKRITEKSKATHTRTHPPLSYTLHPCPFHPSNLDSVHPLPLYLGLARTVYIYAQYMTVYLVISLPKTSYIHRIHMVLANPTQTPFVLQAHNSVGT